MKSIERQKAEKCELKLLMHGLTRDQAAWLLGVKTATIKNWIDAGECTSGLGKTAITFFLALSPRHREILKKEARTFSPRKSAKVY